MPIHFHRPFATFIIVNWNGLAYVERCLTAIRQQTFTDYEVIVIDNGSTDDSPRLIADKFPTLQLLKQQSNLGFAAANNIGAQHAQGTWLALVNNDVFLAPDWLQSMHDATQAHVGCAAFGSCQLQDNNPEYLDGAGDVYHCSGIAWRAGYGQRLGPPWDQEREIFAPCAAAALYKKEAFLACGGFDESYFCYFEDVDLGFRLRLSGYQAYYIPTAKARHLGSASQGKTSDFARYHGHRNMVWTYFKNMPAPLLIAYLPLHLALNLASLLYFIMQGQGKVVWRAKTDALRFLPEILKKRKIPPTSPLGPSKNIRKAISRGLFPLILRD